MINFEDIYLETFSKVLEAESYYFISINQNDINKTYISFYSVWEKFSKEYPKCEIRTISKIDPEKLIFMFKKEKQLISIVDNEIALTSTLSLGGNLLISDKVMNKNWREILEPKIVVSTEDKGFLDYSSISKNYLKRFAVGDFRMELFNRDNYQCRVCGLSPDDSPHVRLEIHHIKPWEEGGISVPENLITLCHTCHTGIKSSQRNVLYKKIGVNYYFQNHPAFGFIPQEDSILRNLVTFELNIKKLKKLFKDSEKN